MLIARLFVAFFVVSGFCSLVDQVVWLRLNMASFGVTTPMVSILLSVFMAGLALGSWGAGALARRFEDRGSVDPLRLYATVELIVAVSVVVVPPGFAAGRDWLATTSGGEWGSGLYYLGAGTWTAILLLPFCVAMGATFPLALWALRRERSPDGSRAFSRLYLANVAGATLGTVVSALVLIEIFGLTGTLQLAASLNALLAASALALSLRPPSPERRAAEPDPEPTAGSATVTGRGRALAILFTTGLASLGMEVVWIRQLTPFLGNLVYSFAIILAVYLSATFVGSAIYRRSRWLARAEVLVAPWPWLALVVAALLPTILADPRLPVPEGLLGGAARAALGIGPFCLLLGALTPMVVDRLTGGDPARAGSAYAVNVVGGILGPLVSGFLLVPRMSGADALLVLGGLPILFSLWRGRGSRGRAEWGGRLGAAAAVAAVAAGTVASTTSFERSLENPLVLRDHTATVAATGSGRERQLLVNGVPMTALSPITKMMSHLPMALLERPPRNGLVVCLGMGTSFRSMRSWGVETTSVELVPSVAALLEEFHEDAQRILSSPKTRIVIDDGRRFLEHEAGRYDVIVIDPPPPVQAAGTSLLYSLEFYRAAKSRLAPDGILQQWIPGGEPMVIASFARAFAGSFRHRRAFRSLEGWGVHLIGSDRPIRVPPAPELLERLPFRAREDLVEWGPEQDPEAMLRLALSQEIPFAALLALDPKVPALRDDFPINEYFALRQARRSLARLLD